MIFTLVQTVSLLSVLYFITRYRDREPYDVINVERYLNIHDGKYNCSENHFPVNLKSYIKIISPLDRKISENCSNTHFRLACEGKRKKEKQGTSKYVTNLIKSTFQ